MNQQTRVGFIGLGRMGAPMVLNLLKAGYSVKVYDVVEEKITGLVQQGAVGASSPADLASDTTIIFSIIMDDTVLEDITSGSRGVFQSAKPGTIFVDLSTVSPQASNRVVQAAQACGVHALVGRVSGSVVPAAQGTLTVFASGDKAIFEQCEPLLRVFGKSIYYVGPHDEAAYLKLSLSIMVAISIGMIGEAIAFAERGGVDRALLVDVINSGPLASSLFTLKTDVLKSRSYPAPTSTVNVAAKDLDMAITTALKEKIPLPLTSITRQLMASLQAKGFGDNDLFYFVEALYDLAGLEKPGEDQ